MRKFLYHGILTAVLSSIVVSLYLFSIYNFVPKGSPDPLVSIDSPMRNELTSIKMIAIYTLLSLIASVVLGGLNHYLGKWGVFGLNALISACSIVGFYAVLSYLKDGWDVFQIIGTPLVYIWPLVWMGCQPLFLIERNSK